MAGKGELRRLMNELRKEGAPGAGPRVEWDRLAGEPPAFAPTPSEEAYWDALARRLRAPEPPDPIEARLARARAGPTSADGAGGAGDR